MIENMVARDGIELSSVLRTRKLLILQEAKRAKRAQRPIPLYDYCTIFFSISSPGSTAIQ